MTNRGHCLCGKVTWELLAEPFHAFNCHCRMCQKVHGAPFGTYWFMRPDAFRWTGATDTVIGYRSSANLVRQSCDVCGSVVPYPSSTGEVWVAPAGCHDTGRRSDCNIFVVDNAPWHTISGDLPRHPAYPEDTGYPSVPGPPPPGRADGPLHGSCLCGAVAYEVGTPLTAVYNCHCGRCRHGRAAAHATNGFAAAAGVRFVRGEEMLRHYKVPDARFFTQVFCRVCSSLMPRIDTARDRAVIPMGGLDDDPGMASSCHIHVANKAPWHDITDGKPQYPQGLPA